MSGVPQFDHIVIVLEENHGYSQIIGAGTGAPYMNSLASNGALFTDSHGVSHPSFPNYLALFSGSVQGTTNDTCPPPGQPYSAANMQSAVTAAGFTFGSYAENLPSNLKTCGPAPYAGRHVPAPWFSNVPTNTIHDFTAFPTTTAGYAALPTVSFVTPNLNDDMHDGTVAQADAWLQAHLSGYATWAQTHNSLLIVQWDEDNFTTPNHIPTIFYGANVKTGQYSETISHYNVLRTILDSCGATPMAAAATAAPITDVWTTSSSGNVPGVPTGLTVTGTTTTTVSLSWTAPTLGPVTGYNVFVNGTKVASPAGTSYTATGLTAGTAYSFTVGAFNSNGTGGLTAPVTATPGGQTNSAWGGWQFTNPAGFTAITATFTIPTLSGDTGALMSVWVGLGDVQQTGIFCGYNTGKPGSNYTRPWTWYLPAGEQWDETNYPTQAGDSLTLTLSFDSTYFYVTQTNTTQSWSYTEQKSIQAASVGGSVGSGAFLFPFTTAQVIIEKEGSSDLPNYGTVTFTAVSVTPAATGSSPITTVNTSTDQTPGAFSGGSFTMTWNNFR